MNLYNQVIGLTKEDVENDIDLKITSAFGGFEIGRCKVSEVEEIVNNHEREIGVDYYIQKL